MLYSNELVRLRGMLMLLALLALLAGAGTVLAQTGQKADPGDWKNVHLLYTTDIKGKIEPCG